MTATKVILFCDESGAKGYADRDEATDGEVGVFAGIMVPETLLGKIAPDFQAIYDRYKPGSGKFHIADLTDVDRQGLRHEIFDAIKTHHLPCFWYAVHVSGFHSFHRQQWDAIEQSRQEQQSRPPDIKRGSPRNRNPSLHVALFQGLYAHLVAFLEERRTGRVAIEIRSDKIDAPILKEFEEAATELLDDQPLVHQSTAFNAATKQVLRGQIIIQAHLPEELELDIVVDQLVISTDYADDPMVLAADVLANSLSYHFAHRGESDKYGALNSREAVLTHPLADSLDAFGEWGDDLLGDGCWAHPKAPHLQRD